MSNVYCPFLVFAIWFNVPHSLLPVLLIRPISARHLIEWIEFVAILMSIYPTPRTSHHTIVILSEYTYTLSYGCQPVGVYLCFCHTVVSLLEYTYSFFSGIPVSRVVQTTMESDYVELNYVLNIIYVYIVTYMYVFFFS